MKLTRKSSPNGKPRGRPRKRKLTDEELALRAERRLNPGRPKSDPDTVNFRSLNKLPELPEDWEKTVNNVCKSGGSAYQLMKALHWNERIYFRMVKENDEFADAVDYGLVVAQAFWEAKLQNLALTGAKCSAPLITLVMKSRFPNTYRDKSEVKQETIIKTCKPIKSKASMEEATAIYLENIK